MDFELSDDQLALRQAARDLLDDRCDHDAVRAHLAAGEAYDHKLWQALCDQGWLGVALPEDQGGLGLGWVEAAVLCEEIGRHTAPVPYLPSLVALTVLSESGGSPADWVADLASGVRTGCVGWSHHPTAGSAAGSADGWSVTGRFGPVEGAAVADLAVVVVPEGVFGVDLALVGRPRREPAMDLTRALSWLVLEAVPATRLGGDELAGSLLDHGAVATSSEMLGGADRVLELAVQYAKDRVQFDQPIGSFQAVKHRCADMVVDVEGMRSSSWYAAWTLAAADPDRSAAASAAKVWCSDASRRVMSSGLQVHGGIGFTWEHDLHLYMKRAQFDRQSYGDAAFHRQRLAGLLRTRLSAGDGLF